MRFLLITLLCLSQILSLGSNQSLDTVRNEFHHAHTEEDYVAILAVESSDLTIKAYQAASTACLAQFYFSPFSKYEKFMEGTSTLDEIIGVKATFETRYIRLLIQLSSPSFLGYNKMIEQDIQFMTKTISSCKLSSTTLDLLLASLESANKKRYDISALKYNTHGLQ